MSNNDKKSTSTGSSDAGINISEEKILDRDQDSPVSVSPEGEEKPSYTHNADKSDPLDSHLSDDNSPDKTSGSKKVDDDALDRDQDSPVSVSPKDKEKPSYTHNADSSDQS